VRSSVKLKPKEGGGELGRCPSYGAAKDKNGGEYTMGTVDGGGRTYKRQHYITSKHYGNCGGKQKNAVEQTIFAAGSYGFRKKGMVTVGQVK
jgi:hypothetical protein